MFYLPSGCGRMDEYLACLDGLITKCITSFILKESKRRFFVCLCNSRCGGRERHSCEPIRT